MTKPFIILFLTILFGSLASCVKKKDVSNNYDDPKLQSVDSLFTGWDKKGNPGGAVGIIKQGEIIFAKGYGLASLNFLVPNTDTTLFNIASVSKQFTAYGMLLLQAQGKLNLEDEIQEYIPELPDFGDKVTIRQMLQHTSGLRSLHALLGMAGWRGDDSRTNEDLMRFMVNQKELNFTPGSEYLYCNTGFILSAIIIERVTGTDFPTWMKENVFEPLSMSNTYVEDKYNRVVENNATSYYYDSDEDKYWLAVPYWGYTGSGNIHTNVYDMMKWMEHLMAPGDKENLVQEMTTNAILNDGDTINYALGINHTDFEGYQILTHGGSIGGFRANMVVIPSEKIGVVVLSNFSNAGAGGKTRDIVRILLDISFPEEEGNSDSSPSEDESEEQPAIPSEYVSDLPGEYYSPELMTSYWIINTDSTMILYHPRHGASTITYHSADTLDAERNWLYLSRDTTGEVVGLRATNGRVRNMWFEKVD